MGYRFLFQRRPDPAWTREGRALFWLWNGGWLFLAGVGLGAASLGLAAGPYSLPEISRGWLERPLILVLNLAPVLILEGLLYGLFRRAWASFALTAAVVIGLSAGNYFKLSFRNDPLMFGDLLLLKEAGNMAGKYPLTMEKPLVHALAYAAAGTLFLFLAVRGRPGKGKGLLSVPLAAGMAGIFLLIPVAGSSRLYDGYTAYYDHLESIWSETQRYIAHGFLYPFLHSAVETLELPPAGYQAGQTAGRLNAYPQADIPEDQRVNIVALMLESYNDFSKFGIPGLSPEVYQVWHELEAEGYSGDLVTNIFGGGTVDTERCFLTGYSHLRNFRGNTNAYPWYFRSQGYRVEGMHPSYQWFYNRGNVNQYLGFEDYFFLENYFSPLTGGTTAADSILFPELLKAYQAGTAGDQPYFNFTVTYQGHGPYGDEACIWAPEGSFVTNDGSRTQKEQYILENYIGSVANTNWNLQVLTDYFRQDNEPVVLVLFGDHNPYMGDGNHVYASFGLDFDMGERKGFLDYYATRYIIWANGAAKERLGKNIQGEGPAIGPYFLMNLVFEQCGWEGPSYLQAIAPVAESLPVVHATDRYLENGELTEAPSPEGDALLREYQALQYYERRHFSYENKK